jgi:anti-sigma B factor antagonist
MTACRECRPYRPVHIEWSLGYRQMMDDPYDGAELSVTASLSGGTLRVGVVGDVDLASAPRLEAMLDLARLDGVYRLELDLSGVTFFSCAGIAAVHGAHRDGLRLLLVAAAPSVNRMLALFPASGRQLEAA